MTWKAFIYFSFLNLAVGLAVLVGALGLDTVAWTYAQLTPRGASFSALTSDECPLKIYESQRMDASKMALLSVGRQESQECFSLEKPAAVNWLVMVNHLNIQGVQYLAILSDLSAGDPLDVLTTEALNFEFEAFKAIRYGRVLRMGLSAEPLSSELAGTRLEPRQIKGDLHALSEMNQRQAPYANHEGLRLPEGGIVPQWDGSELSPSLLYRWDGEVYASFPLLFALDVLGLELKDIRVELGHALHLNAEHVIDIDAAARLLMDADSPSEISLTQLMEGKAKLPAVCLLRDEQQDVGMAPALLRTASILIGEQSKTPLMEYQPLPALYLWLFVLLLCLETMCLVGWQGKIKMIAFLFILLQIGIFAGFLARYGIWMNVASPFAAALAVFILSYTLLALPCKK